MAALVLHDVGVAALDRGQRRGHVGGHAVAHVPEVEVVGRPHPDRRHLAGRVLRPVDVGREPDAVAHRHHHLALDDGDRLQLLLGREPLGPFRRRRGRTAAAPRAPLPRSTHETDSADRRRFLITTCSLSWPSSRTGALWHGHRTVAPPGAPTAPVSIGPFGLKGAVRPRRRAGTSAMTIRRRSSPRVSIRMGMAGEGGRASRSAHSIASTPSSPMSSRPRSAASSAVRRYRSA